MSAGRNNVSLKKDWNAPPKYVELVKNMLGNIDLDPCSNEFSMVDAKVKYILPTDGLSNSWDAKTIFVNPPYGRDVDRKTSLYDWIKKGMDSSKLGSEVLYLIPVATNTRHFKDIIFKQAKGICFLSDTRLKFWNCGSEDKKGAPMACCIVYFGQDYDKFYEVFKLSGKCFLVTQD